jgi:2-polyprenyl-3-methyl-5-hydroxy-6-metoxy-1,4-benzoquinol methylase
MRRRIVDLMKSIVSRLMNREIIILPAGSKWVLLDTSASDSLFPINYTYRAKPDGIVEYIMQVSGENLSYILYAIEYENLHPKAGGKCLVVNLPTVKRGDRLKVNLVDNRVWFNDKPISVILSESQQTRKYIAEFTVMQDGKQLARQCTHYLPFDNKEIGSDYYFGDDYISYPEQTGRQEFAPGLVKQYCNQGRLLDVGCALGVYTKAFVKAGFDAYGMDISEFAIQEANKGLKSTRFLKSDVNLEDIPFEGDFDIFWMWDVLEHFSQPESVLEKISQKAKPNSYLFLHTSNSSSLTHRIFDSDWEGYSDYSHYGIEKVSSQSLKLWLEKCNWEIIKWECLNTWIWGVDPVFIRLYEVFRRVPELSLLLSERELGDAILVVARKREY